MELALRVGQIDREIGAVAAIGSQRRVERDGFRLGQRGEGDGGCKSRGRAASFFIGISPAFALMLERWAPKLTRA